MAYEVGSLTVSKIKVNTDKGSTTKLCIEVDTDAAFMLIADHDKVVICNYAEPFGYENDVYDAINSWLSGIDSRLLTLVRETANIVINTDAEHSVIEENIKIMNSLITKAINHAYSLTYTMSESYSNDISIYNYYNIWGNLFTYNCVDNEVYLFSKHINIDQEAANNFTPQVAICVLRQFYRHLFSAPDYNKHH